MRRPQKPGACHPPSQHRDLMAQWPARPELALALCKASHHKADALQTAMGVPRPVYKWSQRQWCVLLQRLVQGDDKGESSTVSGSHASALRYLPRVPPCLWLGPACARGRCSGRGGGAGQAATSYPRCRMPVALGVLRSARAPALLRLAAQTAHRATSSRHA